MPYCLSHLVMASKEFSMSLISTAMGLFNHGKKVPSAKVVSLTMLNKGDKKLHKVLDPRLKLELYPVAIHTGLHLFGR